MNNYINYHCHTQFSNVVTPDSTISNQDRANRAKQLGMTVLSGIEHGTMGRFIEIVELANKNEMKPLLGSEVYFVKNRLEKDSTNTHLVLLAKNERGRKEINRALSEANTTGYYYKPRLDFELLFSINPNNVWVTTACAGGIWKYQDSEEILCSLFSHFGTNLFLEVQPHATELQKSLNKKILELSSKHGIRIIAGMDSHMIYKSQEKERLDYLLSRGIQYGDEDGWLMDFPSYDEAYQRFVEQGILNENQIKDALSQTLIFESVEVYDSVIFDNSKIKLPSIHKDMSQDEKNEFLKRLVFSIWEEEKKNVESSLWEKYVTEINKELDVVFTTHMADYFLLDYEIIKRGKELGGSITMTGRGSAPSFYLSKLLGFTTIDRISASVKLFPERFISSERLLLTKSLPDIDFNLGTPSIFAQAQEEVIGRGHSYPMIAYGTVKQLGAWKLYARVSGVDFITANQISEQLQQYEFDLKHVAEDDKESVDVMEYIEPKYHDVYRESLKYLGMVNTITKHPCAYLIFDEGDIREEFGLIKIKTGDVENICANIDGLFAEQYKFLKNDLLKVAVVDLIYRVYNRIGLTPHPLPELLKICNKNTKVWDVYKNAWGMGINQVEQSGTIGRVAKYAPKNISELSAFVAAIRPGFKSNYKQFEAREHFEYGVKTIDSLIQTREFSESYMLYQENAMQIMEYAGIPISETYDVIKNIAKKRVDKVLKYKDIFVEGMKKRLIERENLSVSNAESISFNTWQIIEDSSRYSFNASHSYAVAGDSLYGAYLKSTYPLEFYEVFLNMLEEDGDKDRLALVKEEASKAFGIKFPQYKFRQDNREIKLDKETNSVSSSLQSIKGFNHQIGEDLYRLGQFNYIDFIDFLVRATEENMFSSKFEKLIKIGYFSEFGESQKLLIAFKEFKEGKSRYSKTHKDATKEKRISELKNIFESIPNTSIPFREQITSDLEILGNIQSTYPHVNKNLAYVVDVNEKFAPRIRVYTLKKGVWSSLKIYRKTFEKNPFGVGDIILCKSFEKKFAQKYIEAEDRFIENKDEIVWWLTEYEVIRDVDKVIHEKL